jgi:hypothetical protein
MLWVTNPDMVTTCFGDPMRHVGNQHPGTCAPHETLDANLGRDPNGSGRQRFDTRRPEPLADERDLTALLSPGRTPTGKVLTVIKQQMIASSAHLADRSLDDVVGGKPVAMAHHMHHVSPANVFERCPTDLEILRRTTRTRNPAVAIGEMNGRTVPDIDRMMLKRDAFVLAPHEEVITACQNTFLLQVTLVRSLIIDHARLPNSEPFQS